MTQVQVPDPMLRRALEGSGVTLVGSTVDAAELGADPDAGKSHPPLLVAVESGDPARIDQLLAAGASVAPAFTRIVESGSVDLVKRAIALAPNELRTEHLARAVKRGSEEVVRAAR